MRWIEPKNGDIKVKKKFAIIPITIDGETRWLERVTVKYQYYERVAVWTNYEHYTETGWFPVEFIDKENEGKLCPNCDDKKSHPIKDNIGIAAQYQCPKCGRIWYENEDE